MSPLSPLRPWGRGHRRHLAAVAALVVVALAAAAWSGQQWEPHAGTALHARRIVILGVPGLTLADLRDGRAPQIAALAAGGAYAALNVRTGSRGPSPAEAYATLGAGARVKAASSDGLAYDAGAPVANVTGRDALALRTGARPADGVVALGAAHLRTTASHQHLGSLPGALGQALVGAGRHVAVVGDPTSALAVMDQTGVVGLGSVHAADGVSADIVAGEVADALASAEVVVVGGPQAAGQGERTGLAQADDLAGALGSGLDSDTVLVVAGVTPATSEWALTALVVSGADVPHGALSSTETKRTGLVTLTSLAPTVLDVLGIRPPSSMPDTLVRAHAGGPTVADLAVLNRDTVYRERVYYPITIWYVVLQVLAVYVVATVAMGIARRRGVTMARTARLLRPLALATAAFPLCTYIWRTLPGMSTMGWNGAVVLVLLTAVVTAVVSLDRRWVLASLTWLLAATVALLVVDTASGARLEPASILGYSPHTSSRFFGLGNTAMAVLASSVLLLGAVWMDRVPPEDVRARTNAWIDVAGLFAVVFVVAAAPTLGSKVGAFLTLLPIFAATLWYFSGRRITWRVVPAVAVLVALAVGVAGGLDALRPSGSRTHLGTLFRDTSEGGGTPLRLVVIRKLEVTVRMTLRSQWTAVIPLIAALFLFMLIYERRYERMLPIGSPLRAGVVAALAAGLLGTFVNDSGSVVVALAFVFVGPLATLLVCARLATGRWPAELAVASPAEPQPAESVGADP